MRLHVGQGQKNNFVITFLNKTFFLKLKHLVNFLILIVGFLLIFQETLTPMEIEGVEIVEPSKLKRNRPRRKAHVADG